MRNKVTFKFRLILRSFSSVVESVLDLENVIRTGAWNLGLWAMLPCQKKSYEILKNGCSGQKKTGESFSMT